MSYTPNTWQNGDTITAAKLNNMENGISGASAFIIRQTFDEPTEKLVMDKTWFEIYTEMKSGKRCFLLADELDNPPTWYEVGHSEVVATAFDGVGGTVVLSDGTTYETTDINGYPSIAA